jgi:hypothetical protein
VEIKQKFLKKYDELALLSQLILPLPSERVGVRLLL